MNYEESAKIVELANEIKQLKADITHLQSENKEIRQILSTFINQNAVELSRIHAQKDKNNATLTQHGLSAGFTSQTPNGVSELTQLRFNAIHTQQNSFSHRQNDGGHSTLLARAIADISAEQENGQSHSSDRERNRAESRSDKESRESGAISRRGGAQSRESGAISRTGKDIETIYRKSLKCTELEKAEFQQFLVEFRQLNEKIEPDLEKKCNDNISKIIKEHNKQKPNVYVSQYEHFTQETMKKIRKEAFFLESYGYKVSQKNIDEIKKLLSQTQSKVMSL